MSVDGSTVRTLVANDLRLLVRSRRTLFASVVLPLLVWPAMLYLSNLANVRQEERAETAIYTYYLSGAESPRAELVLARARALHAIDPEGSRSATDGATDELRFQFEPLAEELRSDDFDPLVALADGELDLWIEALTHADLPAEELSDDERDDENDDEREEKDAEKEELASSDFEAGTLEDGELEPSDEVVPDDTLALLVRYRGDYNSSEQAFAAFQDLVQRARTALRTDLLAERGFALSQDDLAHVEVEDVASAAQSSGLKLGRFLTALLLMFLVSGGSIVAMDSLAGEKERGTLETLLTTAASRLEIVTAKSLAILVVALVITVIQILDLLLFIGLGLIPLPEGFTVPITAPLALLLLFLFLPLAALISTVLLLVSGYARTYKEAQLLFFPLFLLTVVPALVVILPGIKLRSPIALVPISNTSVAVKEALAGSFDWPMIALTWIVNAALAAFLARVSIRALSSERLVTANDFDEADLFGGPRLFGRYVLRWFAALWAVFLLWQLNVGTSLDMRIVLSINMALMVGTALYLVRRYDLELTSAIPLRLPKPAVWPAVLVGAPAGLLATVVIGNLWSRFFDIPEEVLERFSEQLIQPDYSTATALFFFAILPGVCEELTFRGVLLYGLKQGRSLWLAILLCGAVFGIFHVSLFRLAPTAFLGVVLAIVTLSTRSVLPAMVWHVLHNATAFLLDRNDAALEPFAGPALWILAWMVLVVAVVVIVRLGRSGDEPLLDRPTIR